MKIVEDIRIKFEQSNWSHNLEFGLSDTIIEAHSELLKTVEADIRKGAKNSPFG
ncbi:MAG: hypothetical protein LBK58_14715 [Prevotellaceae bacterium]|nr:hypothetical protein [Prevotellaceae bacterium]